MKIMYVSSFLLYWIVRKVRAAKDLNLINEIKNLNLLRFNFPSKIGTNFPDNPIYKIDQMHNVYILYILSIKGLFNDCMLHLNAHLYIQYQYIKFYDL